MMRPDDFNMAMRHDLVCILRDVVGLIARIESSIPNTPEESHERTSRTTGECPEASPVEEAPAVAVDGAAESQGTVATIPDQPASVSPPDAAPVEPPAPAKIAAKANELSLAQVAPVQSRTDHALDLWSTTALSEQQIAEQVGCALGSVKAFVSAARKKNDPRAFARKLPHDEKLSQPPASKLQPVLITRKDEEREPPVAGFAKPVERKPFSKPLDPRPGRLAGVVITSPGSVVALDMDNLVVACPGGDWQVSRPVALIMERMRNGETFDDQTLAEVGSMGLSTFADSRKRWTEELAKLGIEFVHTKGVGCKIRVAGT